MFPYFREKGVKIWFTVQEDQDARLKTNNSSSVEPFGTRFIYFMNLTRNLMKID